jgi:signal transduction histidine kinase
MGVSGRLERALRNLIENAASLATEVTVEVLQRADGVVIRVRDNGPGIADEHLPFVFDRFYTTREGGGGSGLGLALVRAVIEGHGGSVQARSAEEGALFEIRLPSGS